MKKTRKHLSILLISVMVLTMFMYGCSNSDKGNTSVKRDLTVVLGSVGNMLDAEIANSTDTVTMVSHIYDKLVEIDTNFEFQPGVAKEWKQVDGVTWEFTIGDGFVFHNGEPLELEDVVYSLERLRNIAKKAGDVANLDTVDAVEPNKVIVKFKEPDITSFRSICTVDIFNKSYCEEVGDKYANAPVGTGPFTIDEYVPGSKLILKAWKDYPFEKPSIDSITFKAIAEAANKYIAVETGEADVTTISYQDYERAVSNDKLQVFEGETTNTAFISMNTQKAPFDNANVRRAMAYATNKEGFAQIKGGAKPIYSMTAESLDIYYKSHKLPDYNLDEAKKLLEAEGYNSSNPLKFEAWIYSADPIVETFQADLKTIGVDMSIKTLEFGVFLEGMAGGEYQLLLGSWNNTSGSELSSLENYYTKSFGNQNISFYDNPRCDELYEKAKATTDREELKEIAKEIQDIAAQDVPVIPTITQMRYGVTSKNIEGVLFHTGGTMSFRDVKIK